ncbi:hypothetical protein [Acetonema longum]|uniref:Uncharacterized protein n=1 Tax=Acetonema longum DSM 6540 TaxID=1009370 RepID=F7NLA1_9FIRM|nr:hypothetical protein [Acetonema longum]EGO63206.1 hypothetical protein ALO_14367 [Acetonema longum DSM 6540]
MVIENNGEKQKNKRKTKEKPKKSSEKVVFGGINNILKNHFSGS